MVRTTQVRNGDSLAHDRFRKSHQVFLDGRGACWVGTQRFDSLCMDEVNNKTHAEVIKSFRT